MYLFVMHRPRFLSAIPTLSRLKGLRREGRHPLTLQSLHTQTKPPLTYPNGSVRQNGFGWRTLTGVILLSAPAALYLWYQQEIRTPLNTITFTKWILRTSDKLSSNSAVLELEFHQPVPQKDEWAQIWKHGIWAVQVKQPQLQIQREYTPLPVMGDSSQEGDRIRLYVRRVKGGEMGAYLLGLSSSGSAEVELRGPTVSWEYPAPTNLHSILFLAGGTGIAPALQVASSLLAANPNLKMKILWANRELSEILPSDVAYWENKFNGRLKVDKFFDSKGQFISKKDIMFSMSELGFTSPDSGTRMVMISGPEGFVATLAGEKVWRGGRETQGRLGGVLAPIVQETKLQEQGKLQILKL